MLETPVEKEAATVSYLTRNTVTAVQTEEEEEEEAFSVLKNYRIINILKQAVIKLY